MAKKEAQKKKAPPAKNKGTQDKLRKSLANELVSIIPGLDSEGLAFLVKQARIHLYNMQVDKLNSAAKAAHNASVRSNAVKMQKARSQKTSDRFEIKQSGSGFFLFYQNGNTSLSNAEMASLVKLVNAQGSQTEICERLFLWLERERTDIFQLVPIADKFDARLKTLAALIKKNFKIKKK